MTWGTSRSFPRAILHVDGDAFFASCEVAKNPSLKGKPVITGKERGIVSAATYEAKARGVVRGMRLFEVQKICPDAIILPSDYETYSLFSRRMYDIVRRYSPSVEEYGIDECFADLSGMRRVNHMSYIEMAADIKKALEEELNMTFSVGLSATKILAKLGSKWNKPSGLTIIPLKNAKPFLQATRLQRVWNIGPNTAAYLNNHGMYSAFDFASKDEAWVQSNLSKPFLEAWRELNGEVAWELETQPKETYQSLQKTKTFTPPSTDPVFIHAQLSKNIENACIKARRWQLVTDQVFFFLKTQDFSYHGYEVRLPYSTALPQDVLRAIDAYFPLVFKKGVQYRATGITLAHLKAEGDVQLDLFGSVGKSEGVRKVFNSIDAISEKYGKHSVFLGSSFQAMVHSAHAGERGELAERSENLFKGESKRRRLGIPFLGEVK